MGSRVEEGYGMGLVRSTSFGRKRVFLSNQSIEFGDYDDCAANPSSKRRCSQNSVFSGEETSLEDLPQEILIRILCGVEHDDLKSLFFVSKAVRDATLIAKESHFAYNTPRKTVGVLPFSKNRVDWLGELKEFEAPNAPLQHRVPRKRLSAKNLADISVALFASGDEGSCCWPRRDLFSEN
ncbi:F-box protein At1g61340-like [Salvia hispanica]|uniref:F-box protein At1g61340-like n=1 Tax=Salvia hispanica TaxID=49212 RepID=UPI0020098FE3|nr:F-box protein At1g61340-like [Salvia hispanica]